MKKKQRVLIADVQRRPTRTRTNRGKPSFHHDNVPRAETDQFTRHGQPLCDSSGLRLSLSLEPQLLSFAQRANMNLKKLSLAEDLLFLHWRSRRCNRCNRSTLHRTTAASGSSANEGEKARWRQCAWPFSFCLFLCQSRQSNASARREIKNQPCSPLAFFFLVSMEMCTRARPF